MAQKRAALLEKRMRREKESLQKKLQLEAELEQKKEEARYARNIFYLNPPPLKTNSSSCVDSLLLSEYIWVDIRYLSCTVFLYFYYVLLL